jgi:hypothetical protein
MGMAGDTLQKALRINLDPRWYGTVAAIGAGQALQAEGGRASRAVHRLSSRRLGLPPPAAVENAPGGLAVAHQMEQNSQLTNQAGMHIGVDPSPFIAGAPGHEKDLGRFTVDYCGRCDELVE